MIELHDLTKRYGRIEAVTGLTTTVRAAAVTAFVGPNGAGKTTTMRMIAGLDRPTRGDALVDGRPIGEATVPLHTLGVVFDGRVALGSRRSVDHLHWIAEANRLPRAQVAHVLQQCGIESVARRRAGRLSLGMYQRLAIATAMLGDPSTLMFDEPTNGLDPEGMVWMREFLRMLAAEGRTVLVSSHLMGELALIADRVLVLGRGRLLADCPVVDLPAQAGLSRGVRARCPDPHRLLEALGRAGDCGATAAVFDADTVLTSDTVLIPDATTGDVAAAAAAAGLTLGELVEVTPSLEEAYLALTESATQYRATVAERPAALNAR